MSNWPMDLLLDRITISGGRLCVRGIWVSRVLDLLASGESAEEVARHCALDIDDVRACVGYAARMLRHGGLSMEPI